MTELTNEQIVSRALDFVANEVVPAAPTRNLTTMFPGYFPGAIHNHYADFGYPKEITFELAHQMYCRNSIARGSIEAESLKVWETYPQLLETEASDDETSLEKEIRLKFRRIRFWQKIKEADKRSTVGRYAGIILRLADDLDWKDEATRVSGLDGLVDIIPAWEGQLTVSEWDTDANSETYGEPKMYQFKENAVGEDRKAKNYNSTGRDLTIHPSRVIIWSEDGTLHGQSSLESGYNDLIDIEKVKGAGAESFWKNSKRDITMSFDKDVRPDEIAQGLGVTLDKLKDAINERVQDWQTGLHKMLAFKGADIKTLPVQQISPEHFIAGPLSCYAASRRMPLKILIGTQTGERASSEDSDQWDLTCQSHRTNRAEPNIDLTIKRFEQLGILPERDWILEWPELIDSSDDEKLARADKMADINAKSKGETVFTGDEMRAEVGKDPLSDAERYVDDLPEGDGEESPLSLVEEGAA